MRPRQRRSTATQSRARRDEDTSPDVSEGDSDSDWGNDDVSSSSSSFEASEELQRSQKRPSPAAKRGGTGKRPPSQQPVASSKRKRARVTYDSSDDLGDEEDFLPSHARKTDKGGYAHTNTSKSRISRANKGNKPWNKGKNRSAEDRAKISAGVKARNRAILLKKLKKLGLSEEQWLSKRKEIKALREKVRKTKVEVAKRSNPPAPAEQEVDEESESDTDQEDEETQPVVFSRDMEWTLHEYDLQEHAYQQACPTGGPGGLICCETCTAAYSRYLTQTAKDVEEQTNIRIGKEVQEVMGFMRETGTQLREAVQTARQKPPPRRQTTGRATVENIKWDLTSTIDIGGLGPTAKI